MITEVIGAESLARAGAAKRCTLIADERLDSAAHFALCWWLGEEEIMLMKCACVAAITLTAGCFGTLPDRVTLFAAQSTPQLDRCKAKFKEVRGTYNGHVRWTNRLAVAAVVIGAGTLVVNGIASKTQPGEGATDVADAMKKEGEISGLEIVTLSLAGLAFVSTGITGLEAKWMSEDTTQLDNLTGLINRLSAGTQVPEAELLACE